MVKSVIYGNSETKEANASGVAGMLCRSLNGTYFLRVTTSNGEIQDYDLLHSDLAIKIDKDALASFYVGDGMAVLDHSSAVLGLKVISSEL